MPGPLKVLFDEGISCLKTVEAMNVALAHAKETDVPEFVFLHEFMKKKGIKDKVWVPKAAKAGYRLIITTDQGNKKRGDKLPELCEKNRITHIMVVDSLRNKGLRFLTFGIVAIWPNIVEAYHEKTLRFKLRLVEITRKDEVGKHRFGLFRV